MAPSVRRGVRILPVNNPGVPGTTSVSFVRGISSARRAPPPEQHGALENGEAPRGETRRLADGPHTRGLLPCRRAPPQRTFASAFRVAPSHNHLTAWHSACQQNFLETCAVACGPEESAAGCSERQRGAVRGTSLTGTPAQRLLQGGGTPTPAISILGLSLESRQCHSTLSPFPARRESRAVRQQSNRRGP